MMDKLSYKLRKNEDKTDISLYQIYQPELHENILKYRLNLVKEITIGFNYDLQTTWESPASLSDGLLESKCYHFACLWITFDVA